MCVSGIAPRCRDKEESPCTASERGYLLPQNVERSAASSLNNSRGLELLRARSTEGLSPLVPVQHLQKPSYAVNLR